MFAKRIQRTFAAFWCSCRANVPSEQHKAMAKVGLDGFFDARIENSFDLLRVLFALGVKAESAADADHITDMACGGL